MKEFISKHSKLVVILSVIVILVFIIRTSISIKEEEAKQAETDRVTEELLKQAQEGQSEEDSLLMQMQPELIETYGSVPDGFIWQADGTVLSLGDKNMSSEDVIYAYFKGLSSLDISTVERYSRESMVVQTYSGYFDEKNKNTDYLDQFIRNMYKQCLLSIQINGIEDQSIFAENKQVFTVSAKMLDLTNKDFWEKDKKDIFEKLYLYDSDESDSTKGDIYLYDYILSYYKSGSAGLRDVSFNVTVQRYPDLDSGWLVSVDTDVDDACQYKDGNLVVSYIKDVYRDVGRDMVMESMSEEES